MINAKTADSIVKFLRCYNVQNVRFIATPKTFNYPECCNVRNVIMSGFLQRLKHSNIRNVAISWKCYSRVVATSTKFAYQECCNIRDVLVSGMLQCPEFYIISRMLQCLYILQYEECCTVEDL